MNDYLDMECKNCGRHRVEQDNICEKCNYDNAKNEYANPVKEESQSSIDAFHKHLDSCAQCRNHPFALCEIGYKLLKSASNDWRRE